MSDAGDVLRQSLWPLSFLWAVVTAGRNLAYEGGLLRSHGLDVPVVSVGNLTVGGTGKTPFVVWLVERARSLGRRPGVLARGYGRAPGARLNDEGLLIQRRFPDLPQVQDPDRVAGGRRLLDEHDVDLVVLDDGFQHRRLRRDLDIVCLDARRPFGRGLLLPAGDLREPRGGLRRAGLLVLTRAAGMSAGDLAARSEKLRRLAGRPVPVLAATHTPARVRALPGGEVHDPAWLRERRVHLLSSIARPSSFRDTVAGLGAEIVAHTVRRDHHRHTPAELLAIRCEAENEDAVILTTEKDAVKFDDSELPHLVLEVDLEFIGRGPTAEELGLS